MKKCSFHNYFEGCGIFFLFLNMGVAINFKVGRIAVSIKREKSSHT